ncbi:MAG: ATP-binding protein [Proteobacteria bacterium]|nr:ATP-binding protein [Pseudomonadota bacterium]
MNEWPLDDILSLTPILCFVVDAHEQLISLHGGLIQQLGLNSEKAMGSTAFKLVNLPVKRHHYRKVMQGATITINLSIHGSSYETHLSPLWKGETIEGVVGLTTDTTKQLAMEQQLDEQRHSLLATQRLNSLAGIASGLAHEINNPLAIVSGYAQQLQILANRDKLPKDRLVFTTSKIVEGCQRCHLIIESLKNFARDGSQDPFEVCSINELLTEALQLSEQTFLAMGVLLQAQALPEDITLKGRRLQLIQAIFNILSNACEAALKSKEPKVTVQAIDLGDHVTIEIKDNGPGIPESLRVKIFEPFFTTKEQLRSVGVGLSTAKGMVEEHQGCIKYTSSPGDTCFSIILPKQIIEKNQAS